MDKIQTAREIAIELGEIGLGSQWINATERRIRSRDRAIVERCKAVLGESSKCVEWDGSISQAQHISIHKIDSILDSVLRELEGKEVPNV